MPKSPEMANFLDLFTQTNFGYTRREALEHGKCVTCREVAGKFTDECSRREYKISGMCQKCQDEVFKDA